MITCDIKYEMIRVAATSNFAACMQGSWETVFDLSTSEIVNFLLKSKASTGVLSSWSYTAINGDPPITV